MATLAEEKYQLFSKAQKEIYLESTSPNLKIVAEGDSWFDYPFHKDIVDYLIKIGYAVANRSKQGDELENMAYNEAGLSKVLFSVQDLQPKFVILSAGGNDVVGQEVIQYLNHSSSGLALFKEDIFTLQMNGAVKTAIQQIINKILNIKPDTQIIMHGYAYPFASGKKYEFLGLGIVGPWLLPAFQQKGIETKATQSQIIIQMVDIFNEVLISLDTENPNFHYLNLRSYFTNESEWNDEIHLKSKGFEKVADLFHEKITDILGSNPITSTNILA